MDDWEEIINKINNIKLVCSLIYIFFGGLILSFLMGAVTVAIVHAAAFMGKCSSK